MSTSRLLIGVSLILIGISGCGTEQTSYVPTLVDGGVFLKREPFVSTKPTAQKYENTISGISFQYPEEFTLEPPPHPSSTAPLFKRGDECMVSVSYYDGVFDKKTYKEYGTLDKVPEIARFQLIETAHAIAPLLLEMQNPHDVTIGDNTWFTFVIDQATGKMRGPSSVCKEVQLQQIYILPKDKFFYKFTFYSFDEKTIEKILATVKVTGPIWAR